VGPWNLPSQTSACIVHIVSGDLPAAEDVVSTSTTTCTADVLLLRIRHLRLLLQQQLLQLVIIIINTGVIVKRKWGNGCCWVGERLLDLCEIIYDVYFEDLWGSDGRLDDFGLLLHVSEE